MYAGESGSTLQGGIIKKKKNPTETLGVCRNKPIHGIPVP